MTHRLLVVDDEPAILKLLKTLLTRAKYDVTACSSGEEALRALSQGSFDLIITDAMMPVMNGFELVRKIRDDNAVPILMLTRKNERADVAQALEAGVTDYVIKPIDELLLLDKVAVSLKHEGDSGRLRGVAVHGSETQASGVFDVRVVSIRESGITVRLPISWEGFPFRLDSPLFKQIGISAPLLKFIRCENKPSKDSFADFPYEAEFGFLGMPETELRKIRSWLQRQEIQRKK